LDLLKSLQIKKEQGQSIVKKNISCFIFAIIKPKTYVGNAFASKKPPSSVSNVKNSIASNARQLNLNHVISTIHLK
jgi:hypothetical protein